MVEGAVQYASLSNVIAEIIAPAALGRNAPVFTLVIPLPLQIPGSLGEFKSTNASEIQKGPAGSINDGIAASTITSVVNVEIQFPNATMHV